MLTSKLRPPGQQWQILTAIHLRTQENIFEHLLNAMGVISIDLLDL
jgi:hypothetical protein